jgi:hypothetical protein
MRTIPLTIVVLTMVLSIEHVALAQQPCKSTVVGDLRIEQFQSKFFDRMITVRVWLPLGYNDASQAHSCDRRGATLRSQGANSVEDYKINCGALRRIGIFRPARISFRCAS